MSKKKWAFTRAEFARRLGKLNRLTATFAMQMFDGMWNPDFCAAEMERAWALSFIQDCRAILDDMESRLPKDPSNEYSDHDKK